MGNEKKKQQGFRYSNHRLGLFRPNLFQALSIGMRLPSGDLYALVR